MAEPEFKPKRLTMKNTKQQMLQAYNEVLQHLKARREAELKPERAIEARQVKEAVEVTDSLSTAGIVEGIAGLRLEIGKLLSELSDKLEEEVSKYRQVKKAVEAREQELQEIYGIEKEALSLAALIEAQNQKRQETESELTAIRDELTHEIEMLRVEVEEEKKQHAAELKERAAAEKKQREREREEYEYAFKREQQLAREQFEDEKARLEREIAFQREELAREFAEREQALTASEHELNELREQVRTFPQQLESAVNQAVEEAVQRVTLEAQNREALLKKEFEGERNVLNTRIAALEKTVKEQNQQISKLIQEAERAHVQVQDIAVKAIEGTSRAQSLTGLQQLIAEQTRKEASET